MPRDDLTNQRFGQLLVRKRVGTNHRGEVLWYCVCDCGGHVTVKTHSLRTGHTCSCGCIKPGTKGKYDCVGKKFHKLTIIKFLHSDRFRESIYEYECECGNRGEIRKHKIGKTKSCPKCRWGDCGELTRGYWENIKRNAKCNGRNIDVEITIEDAWQQFVKQDGNCALTGIKLKLARTHTRLQTASLDRIDSTKGYILGNIQWVHKKVNELKWDLSNEELFYWCNLIVKHNNGAITCPN